MKTNIIMRAHNDMPVIAQTLAMVAKQTVPYEIIAFDNESSDGTTEELKKYTDHIVTVPKGQYVPGKVLNHGMKLSQGDIVAFLNSDCTPQDEFWLKNLIDGFTSWKIAAVFGRQKPRFDCHPLHAKDTDAAYGDGELQKYWKHCFSMASSAILRSVWEKMPFNEKIQYSEDIEWTWEAKKQGYEIKYIADAVVSHSHNYSFKQFYKRHYGEGRAEAVFFDWSKLESLWLRYSLLPFGKQLLNDWKYGLKNKNIQLLFESPIYRLSQMRGRRSGFLDGLKERGEKTR